MKISAAFGSIKGDTTLIINSSVKATKNQRAVHTHQTKCDTKTQCAATYTSWVVTLNTTLDVTTTVELGGTPVTVNVSGTFGGANTDHTYSKTDPHPGDVRCGPENWPRSVEDPEPAGRVCGRPRPFGGPRGATGG